jgi:hypothetical protein
MRRPAGGRICQTSENIDATDLKQGATGLVIAVVAGVRDTLKQQALRVMDGGVLDDGKRGRLGRAMLKLETALDDLINEQGVRGTAKAPGDEWDALVGDMVDRILHPEMSFRRRISAGR